MRTIGSACLALLLGFAASPVVGQLVIDDFETGEFLHVAPPGGGNLEQSDLPTENVLGGHRRVFLRDEGQTATLSLTPGDDAVVFSQNGPGDFFLEWSLDDLPLDLTAGGTLDQLEIDIETLTSATDLFLFAGGQWGPVSQQVTGPGTYVFPYADLPGPMTGLESLTLSSSLGQSGGTMAIAEVRAVPEPTALLSQAAIGVALAILARRRQYVYSTEPRLRPRHCRAQPPPRREGRR